MGMPMPTLIKSTFKTIESGYHNCMFWELIQNGFLCKESKFFLFYTICFPIRAIENVGGENTKTISFKKLFWYYIHIVPYMSVKCIPPYTPLLYSETGVFKGIHFFLFLIQNIHCGYPLERQGGSNV